MSTHRSTWKRREREAARIFGAERQPGSGSGGRVDQTRSDSTHPRLFIETKLRAASAVRSLWEAVRDRARAERKTPVLMLYAKGRPGGLVVIHEADLAAVAAEYRALTPPADDRALPAPEDDALDDRRDRESRPRIRGLIDGTGASKGA